MRIDTLLGSLIGAFVIYGVAAACSSGAGAGLLADAGLIDGSGHDAKSEGPVPEAEAAPADCAQWEFQVRVAPALNTPVNTGNWEPVGGNLTNSSTGETEIFMRRCVP